jgi:hypothetical protein
MKQAKSKTFVESRYFRQLDVYDEMSSILSVHRVPTRFALSGGRRKHDNAFIHSTETGLGPKAQRWEMD